MRSPHISTVLVTFGLVCLTGCVTSEQMDLTQTQIAALDHRLARLQEGAETSKKETIGQISTVSGSVDQAFEKVQTRQSSLGTRIDDVHSELMATVRDVQDLKASLQSQSALGEDRRTDLRKETDRKVAALETGLQQLAGTLQQVSEQSEANRKATQTDAAQLRNQMDQRLRRLDREVQGIYGVIEKAFSGSSDEPAEDSGDVYEIQSGDSLGKIAVKFGCSVSALMQLNGITDPNLIRVGQKLKIPK